VSDLAELMFR